MRNVPESEYKWLIEIADEDIQELETFSSSSFQYSGMMKFIIRMYRRENRSNKIFLKKTDPLIT